MTARAPRAFNREIYHDHREQVFYGTDDGFQDGTFGEFVKIRAHYDTVPSERREDVHLLSVAGGLYFLNLIPLWQPKRITIFDINPTALTYFRIIHRVFTTSSDVEHFLARLTAGDYDAVGEQEEFVRENICRKQRGELDPSRGSNKRSFRESWKVAFDHFDLTKKILTEAPLELRSEPMESEGFREWIREQSNLWIYCSNIAEFHYFDLEFDDPANTVLLQIIFPGQAQTLDLASFAGEPVRVRFRIPLAAEPIQGVAAAAAVLEELVELDESRQEGRGQRAHKRQIETTLAPPSVGTHSQAIRTGDLVFVTGQTGRDPETGALEDGLSAQSHRVFANVDAILNAAGCTREDIVKSTLLLASIADFKAVDQIYASWLPNRERVPLPTRTAFEVAALPAGALLMLEVVAAVPGAVDTPQG